MQLCPAQHSSWDPSLPASPALCTSWGQILCPAELSRKGESPSSRDAEHLGSYLGQLRAVGQLPPTAHSSPWGKTPQSAKGQVSNAPTTSEEKQPLYYRPQSARGSARRTTFIQDVSIVQQGEEKRGTNPTDPTHGSLVLENMVVWQREAVGERGTSRDERGHL